MNILERIKEKIKPHHEAPKPPVIDDLTPPEPLIAAPEPAQKQYRIPMAAGEYFPWKGHVFKVITVTPMTFTAECVGITKNRAEKLGVA